MSTPTQQAAAPTLMESEYVRLIAQLDLVLSGLKDLWTNARDDKDKAKWMERINASLDERLRFMRLRDTAKTLASTASDNRPSGGGEPASPAV